MTRTVSKADQQAAEQARSEFDDDGWNPDEAYEAGYLAGLAAERGACAELADAHAETARQHHMYPSFCLNGIEQAAERIAAAIRNRAKDG